MGHLSVIKLGRIKTNYVDFIISDIQLITHQLFDEISYRGYNPPPSTPTKLFLDDPQIMESSVTKSLPRFLFR